MYFPGFLRADVAQSINGQPSKREVTFRSLVGLPRPISVTCSTVSGVR